MVNLHDNNISGILADEMGLGKTCQSISLLAFLKEHRGVTGPHLVLVPKSVLGNWCRELAKFCPGLKVCKVAGDKEERSRVIREEMLSGEFFAADAEVNEILRGIEGDIADGAELGRHGAADFFVGGRALEFSRRAVGEDLEGGEVGAVPIVIGGDNPIVFIINS
jgi:hypothetical protein